MRTFSYDDPTFVSSEFSRPKIELSYNPLVSSQPKLVMSQNRLPYLRALGGHMTVDAPITRLEPHRAVRAYN